MHKIENFPEYKEGDDLANIKALKRIMFERVKCGHVTSGSSEHNLEIASQATNAYANLIKAQVALTQANKDRAS